MGLFSRLLVAYDGSPGSERALEVAIQLASELNTSLMILSIVEHLPRFPGTIDEVDDAVEVQTEALGARQRQARHKAEERAIPEVKAQVEVGHAAQLIIAAAERERTDLLILGRSGHSEVWGRFMGSTADKIARHAPCAVLIAH